MGTKDSLFFNRAVRFRARNLYEILYLLSLFVVIRNAFGKWEKCVKIFVNIFLEGKDQNLKVKYANAQKIE